MSELNEVFLTWIVAYGPPALALTLLLAAAGLPPLPSSLFVIAAGAFVRQGVLDGPTTATLALVGAVTGDSISYGLGRFAHGWTERRFGQSQAWQQAQTIFQKRGALAIYLTRWLVQPLALPTNLIAGGSGYPFYRFLLYDTAGEATWIVLYGGAGYAVGSQWELISSFIIDFSGVLVGLLLLGAGVYWLLRPRRASQAVSMDPSP